MKYHCYSMNGCDAVNQFLQQQKLDTIFNALNQYEDVLYSDKIEDLLLELGMPSSLAGFKFCVFALHICRSNPEILCNLHNTLYPMIAVHFETSRSCAEKNIRKAIEKTWLRADPERISKVFRSSVDPQKGKPSNSEFLATLNSILIL